MNGKSLTKQIKFILKFKSQRTKRDYTFKLKAEIIVKIYIKYLQRTRVRFSPNPAFWPLPPHFMLHHRLALLSYTHRFFYFIHKIWKILF